MAAAVRDGEEVAAVRVMAAFTFLHQTTLDAAEVDCIKRAIRKGLKLLNRKHNTQAAASATAEAPRLVLGHD